MTTLTAEERGWLKGSDGPARQLAMQIVVGAAEALEAPHLLPVCSAHIVGCFYGGQVGLDFAERLVSLGARVAVPATTNTGSVDLVHADVNREDAETIRKGRRLMRLYADMGCAVSWTCAPYQIGIRPRLANSVLGARTNRYGDFIDICAAIAGRVPSAGLHLSENRLGEVLIDASALPADLLAADVVYPALGYLVGRAAGAHVPVIVGLPVTATEDQMKALAAAAASAGNVGLFHVVGVTPEAGTRDEAFGGRDPIETTTVTAAMLAAARDALTTATDDQITTVCLGTPHFSIDEFALLRPLLEEQDLAPGVEFYVSTSRGVMAELERRGWLGTFERPGVQLIVDTCTYFPGVLGAEPRVVMTNSAKWAYYAPGGLPVSVVFGSLTECVRSASSGRVWRDEGLWREAAP
jgi:predicted aconitase